MSDWTDNDRCPIVTGRVWAFGLEVPADCILPPPSSDEEPDSLGALLMTPIDPDFPSQIEPGDILVAGAFGTGTTDARPARALRAAGIAAIVSSSLDSVFVEQALAVGLPVVEIYEALALHSGETLRVDLEGGRVVNMSSGNRYPIRNLSDAMLETYREHLA